MIKKLLHNSGLLTLSNIFLGIVGLITIALISKKLSLEEFGYFAIIQTYVLAINSLINFQTWSTVIKYFPSVKNEKVLLASLLRYSYFLDLLTAFLGFIISVSLIYFIGALIDLPEKYFFLAQIFSLSILANIQGTATGFFRSKDNYNYFLYSNLIYGFVKLMLTIFAFYYNATIEVFLIAFLIAQLLQTITLNIFMPLDIIKDILKTSIKIIANKCNEIHSYSMYTNFTAVLDMAFRKIDILVVSAFFGAEMAGAFKIIKTIVGLITQITQPISVIIFPIVSDLIHKKEFSKLRKYSIKSFYILGTVGVVGFGVFYTIEEWLIVTLFSSEYVRYTNYLNLYLISIIISIVFTIVHPITNLIGLHKQVTYLTLYKLILFFIILILLKDIYGFIAFFLAMYFQTILTIVAKVYMIKKKLGNAVFLGGKINE